MWMGGRGRPPYGLYGELGEEAADLLEVPGSDELRLAALVRVVGWGERGRQGEI